LKEEQKEAKRTKTIRLPLLKGRHDYNKTVCVKIYPFIFITLKHDCSKNLKIKV